MKLSAFEENMKNDLAWSKWRLPKALRKAFTGKGSKKFWDNRVNKIEDILLREFLLHEGKYSLQFTDPVIDEELTDFIAQKIKQGLLRIHYQRKVSIFGYLKKSWFHVKLFHAFIEAYESGGKIPDYIGMSGSMVYQDKDGEWRTMYSSAKMKYIHNQEKVFGDTVYFVSNTGVVRKSQVIRRGGK